MTINDTGAHVPASRRHRPEDTVDFTLMYAAHDAFRRDLQCLTAAVGEGQTAAPAVRTSWATTASKQVLGVLPLPARLLCRAVWRPRYARTPRWNTASIRAERQAS